ncbi:MAG TPA: VCBS repeat-containing protein [Kofleriaceae bacterium]
MLHRWYPLVFCLVVACKGSHGAGADAGDAPPDMAPIPDAPPDTGNMCNRVGVSWLPWVVTGGQPSSVAVADVDRDGMPDLVVGTIDDSTVSVLRGIGGGRFQPRASYAIRSGPGAISAVVDDVDHDGKPDLIVISGGVSVLLGNGDGTFQSKIDSAAGGPALEGATGDVDRDGKLDLVVTYGDGDHVGVLLGHGDGTFDAAVTYSTAPAPTTPTVRDLNGDGNPDIIVGSEFTGTVSVLLGKGDGTFQPSVGYSTPQVTTAIAVADLSGDGVSDVASVADTFDQPNASLLFGQGDGSLPRLLEVETARNGVAIALADVDLDHIPDILTTAYLDGSVEVQFGGPNGVPAIRPRRAHVGGFPTSVVVSDVSGDGKPDLVVGNSGADNVSVELGKGDGTFRDAPTGGPATLFFVADLNSDGKPDAVGPVLAFGQTPLASVQVQLGTGDGTFQAPVPYDTNMVPSFAVPADVNHDGKLDIVTLNNNVTSGTATLSVLLGNGDGTFQPKIDQMLDRTSTALATADLDKDGNPDLLVAAGGGGGVEVLLGNGDGTFRTGGDAPTSGTPRQIFAIDLDGDGTLDLAVLGDAVSVHLGHGDGTFRPKIEYLPGAQLLAVADLNRDGKPDLVAELSTTSGNVVRVMLGAGDGTFAPGSDLAVHQLASTIAVADITGDGNPDLVSYSFDAHTLSVLAGDGHGAFQARTDFAGFGDPGTIVIADITSDGRPDILVSGGPTYVTACLP